MSAHDGFEGGSLAFGEEPLNQLLVRQVQKVFCNYALNEWVQEDTRVSSCHALRLVDDSLWRE
jgi:hypothetical protein